MKMNLPAFLIALAFALVASGHALAHHSFAAEFDAQSAERFVGENCGLCRDAQWSLQRKQFPASAVAH